MHDEVTGTSPCPHGGDKVAADIRFGVPTEVVEEEFEQCNRCAILKQRFGTSSAGMAELADAADSKSADLRVMGVRPPLPAPVLKPIASCSWQSRAQ